MTVLTKSAGLADPGLAAVAPGQRGSAMAGKAVISLSTGLENPTFGY